MELALLLSPPAIAYLAWDHFPKLARLCLLITSVEVIGAIYIVNN